MDQSNVGHREGQQCWEHVVVIACEDYSISETLANDGHRIGREQSVDHLLSQT